MKKPLITAGLALIGAAVLALGPVTASHAENSTSEPEYIDQPESSLTLSAELRDEEQLALPAVSTDMLKLSNEIYEQYQDDPRFSTIEITLDRKSLLVWWHGPTPAGLQETLAGASFNAETRETVLLPGSLRDAAAKALDASSDLGITSAAPTKDGSALEVTIDPELKTSQRTAIDIERLLGVPVTLSQPGDIVAASRQNDVHVLGGARVYRYASSSLQNSCTTGFPVQNGTQKGMIFAAHCGQSGSQIVMWPNNTGSTIYAYGNDGTISAVSGAHDAAIIRTNWNTEGVYTGAYTSASATPINGTTWAPIGTELCLSGSYSGTLCGNVVQQTGIHYTLPVAGGGSINVISGIRSVHSGGLPAAGNGDSGGAGYVITVGSEGTKRYAATIISAIPGDSPSVCNGVPGSSTRRCSPTVFTTSLNSALGATGWSITALP